MFEAELRYDSVTTVSLPKTNKRKEVRLSIREVAENTTELDLWASQILKVPLSDVMSGLESPYGADKIEQTLVIPFDKSENIMPTADSHYFFVQGYYTPPSVVTYKLGNNQISRMFIDYNSNAEFKFTTDHTASLNLALTNISVFVGNEASSAKKVKNIDLSKIRTHFLEMDCLEKKMH